MTLRDPAYGRDPAHVRTQYASETNLASRAALYAETTGASAGDLAFAAVAEVAPRRVLDVGCGNGWFGARVRDELVADVVAVDQSERMVELARERGLDARVGDVQDIDFPDGEFDCVAAVWMLYHVPDLDRGLAQIARVLRPGGRLVAITNGKDHLFEMWELAGAGAARVGRDLSFGAENGRDALLRHFARVEMLDPGGTVVITDRDAVVRYIESTEVWRPYAANVPDPMEPFVARRRSVVFIADKADA